MPVNTIIWSLVGLCVILVLVIFSLLKKKEDGAIVINKTDPMKDTYTLELYIPFGELDKRKSVVFRVKEAK